MLQPTIHSLQSRHPFIGESVRHSFAAGASLFNKMEEIWKNIPCYSGKYQVSNMGRVKTTEKIKGRANRKERIRKLTKSKNGYNTIILSISGQNTRYLVHRLVAIVFIKNPLWKGYVNHKNGIKTDNNIENLEWVTMSENHKHAYRELNKKPVNSTTGKFGIDSHSAKPIIAYTNTGELSGIWGGAKEAARNTNYNQGAISMCARGGSKSSYGLIWRYVSKDEYLNLRREYELKNKQNS